jgi:hypothetical protein
MQGYEPEESRSWLWLDSEQLVVRNLHSIIESLKRLLLVRIIFIPTFMDTQTVLDRKELSIFNFNSPSVHMRLERDGIDEGNEAREEDWNL